jgi:hypothetical protein
VTVPYISFPSQLFARSSQPQTAKCAVTLFYISLNIDFIGEDRIIGGMAWISRPIPARLIEWMTLLAG